jgi:histone acetyltransferase (RNA polymerase elongator complex component)
MRYFNIPFFIPELGCPHRCVFCNQHTISGVSTAPAPEAIAPQAAAYLATFPGGERHVEIAFFGGNFTGLPRDRQEAYLEAAAPRLQAGDIAGIRISTRPDYISNEGLAFLKHHGVSTIELGAQSFDDDVLRLSGRGHSIRQIEDAARMIREAGFVLGIQMMTGLPGDTIETTMRTAQRVAELGAAETRIYPTLVLRETHLEKMYREGTYRPIDLEETIERCKQLVMFFEYHGVKILRLGLHPSEGLIEGSELVAGPFHPALRELVTTAVWNDLFRGTLVHHKGKSLIISVAPEQLSAAIGHRSVNRQWLRQHFKKVDFTADSRLEGRTFHADYR